MRKCSNCKIVKSLNEYPNDKARKFGKSNRCLPCKKADDEKHRLKREYNLTLENLEELIKSQNNSCKICSLEFKNNNRHIDHCHKTGKVRGLLCAGCNTAIGKFNDDPELLLRAMKYLQDNL